MIVYLYSGCQVSICPPPRTTNWWPLDHFLRRFPSPVSFRHSCSVCVDSSKRLGWSFINVAVPKNVSESVHNVHFYLCHIMHAIIFEYAHLGTSVHGLNQLHTLNQYLLYQLNVPCESAADWPKLFPCTLSCSTTASTLSTSVHSSSSEQERNTICHYLRLKKELWKECYGKVENLANRSLHACMYSIIL